CHKRAEFHLFATTAALRRPGGGRRPGERSQYFGAKQPRILAKLANTLEHDRPLITDTIQSASPGDPVDGSPSRSVVRVSAAVIVVDVSRGQQAPRGRGLRAEIGREMGMTGIERQGQTGPIELAE